MSHISEFIEEELQEEREAEKNVQQNYWRSLGTPSRPSVAAQRGGTRGKKRALRGTHAAGGNK